MGFFGQAIATFPDLRTAENTRYSIRDAALGAFSVFFNQSPSLIAHQRSMELSKGKSNAGTIFGVHQIPTDNHIRSLLDPAEESLLAPAFGKVFEQLHAEGKLTGLRCFDGSLLVALDGAWFHNSESVHCKQCNYREHREGRTTYYHSAITPVIVSLGSNRVVSLEPEFIWPQDGAAKQDCELLLEHRYNCILTCKYGSNSCLKKWIDEADAKLDSNEHFEKHWDGKRRRTRRYRFANGVPIRDDENALTVNWMELAILGEDGTPTARHVFVTNHELTRENVAAYVDAGRSRWKIENQHNNTLKTKGYNLEHNFGRGKEKLANLLLSMNLLAFPFHTMFELSEPRNRLIRKTLLRRDRFFHDVKALTQYFLFDSWNALMRFMLERLDLEDPGRIAVPVK